MNELTGHAEDSVIELANEVRKVIGFGSRPKEKKIGGAHVSLISDFPHMHLPLQEAIVMDSF